ncbi:hypothetical protein [Nocardioides caricicola]|uniref:DUF3592 domain-containing protein n=1 Tax=Nocardioides caricicola TaxID=634770 RepID=A0ABW0MYJ2_9ACTN
MTEQPVGWIRLTTQGNWFTSNAITPYVRLNGYQVANRYGENVHPVPPGRWHVEAHCQWLREYGQASYDVDVAAGQTVDVFYAPPFHQFARGRMGPTSQPRRGLATFVLLMVLVVLVVGATSVLMTR